MRFLAIALAIVIGLSTTLVIAQGKPTADECKKNPKLPGCEAVRK